jgi:flavodoxin
MMHMFEVVYCSKTGSTKKVAETIAGELGVKAEDVRTKRGLLKGSVVFLGSGCYGRMPGKEMLDFIEKNDFSGRKVALFGTSGSGKGFEVKELAETMKKKGAQVVGRFFCRGALLFIFGRIGEKELEKARLFAQDIKKNA